ncbi:hypothetical protein C8Q70DRAFT_1068552 [Cubamyces menziesii]|nr:hypothetical protein C8Q70DRAFT_1068552 [Cubamyces menziesii]
MSALAAFGALLALLCSLLNGTICVVLPYGVPVTGWIDGERFFPSESFEAQYVHGILLPLRDRCNVEDYMRYGMTCWDCFAYVIVGPVGFVGLCGSSGSLGFFRKVSVATEERAERQDGGGAVEEF